VGVGCFCGGTCRMGQSAGGRGGDCFSPAIVRISSRRDRRRRDPPLSEASFSGVPKSSVLLEPSLDERTNSKDFRIQPGRAAARHHPPKTQRLAGRRPCEDAPRLRNAGCRPRDAGHRPRKARPLPSGCRPPPSEGRRPPQEPNRRPRNAGLGPSVAGLLPRNAGLRPPGAGPCPQDAGPSPG
jgi:hypothetical protein